MTTPNETEEVNVAEEEKTAQEQTQETAEQTEATPEESVQERNWKQFREQRKIEREKAQEAELRAQQKAEEAEALRKALEAVVDKPSKKSYSGDYYEGTEEETDEIEKKLEQMIEERERKRDEERQKREMAELPQRLARDFNDFERICSQENLDYFEYHYPEVAAPFKYMPDNYEKWSSIYKAVNRFMPEVKNKNAEKRAQQNLSKPRSSSAPGAEQTSDGAPMILDEKRREANWQRMQRVMKGIS